MSNGKRVVSVSVKRGKRRTVSVSNSAETHAAIKRGDEPGALARIMAAPRTPEISHVLLARLAGAVEMLANHEITAANVSDESWEGRFTEPEDDPLPVEAANAIGFIAGVAAALNIEIEDLLTRIPS